MSTANAEQREAWNGIGGRRWVADADRRDEVLAPVADALLGAAALQPGEPVLDIGCGCGATTLLAADTVAPAAVVGVDLSAPMLDVARSRAGERAITFTQADAQTDPLPPESAAVAISRFGTMFFDDPVAAFANIRTAVRVGGRLCLATWQPLETNDWLTIAGAALARYAPLPDLSGTAPGMFAQSDAARVEQVLAAAGWHDIEVRPEHLTLHLGADAADATGYVAGTGVARSVLDLLDPAQQDEALATVTAELVAHEGSDGVRLGAGIFLISARR